MLSIKTAGAGVMTVLMRGEGLFVARQRVRSGLWDRDQRVGERREERVRGREIFNENLHSLAL